MKNDKQIWTDKWSFSENIIINSGLLFVGFLLEFINNGRGLPVISFPVNVFLAGFIIIISFLIFITLRKSTLLNNISSPQSAIISIIFLSILILFMGFIPQKDVGECFISKIGLTHIWRSWMYFFILFYLLIILGITIIKRAKKWNLKNICFFLNHLGLWIVLVSASLGNGDIEKIRMVCYLNNPVHIGSNVISNDVRMPFAITLKKFDINYYNPEIVIVNNYTGKIINYKNKFPLAINNGLKFNFYSYKITVEKIINESILFDSAFRQFNSIGSVTSAYIKVTKHNKSFKKGWISNYSSIQQSAFLSLSDSISITIAPLKPKKYSSEISVYTSENKAFSAVLEVNKPVKVMSWELFQQSYDTQLGKYSNYSVILAVRDPWIKIVYSGIFMLLAGSVLLFWIGNSNKNIKQ